MWRTVNLFWIARPFDSLTCLDVRNPSASCQQPASKDGNITLDWQRSTYASLDTGLFWLQVVWALFQTGLWGEGSLLRHLKPYQYTLAHQQSPLHELDFGVVSLSTDLRDGLRLCKLSEILTGAQI